MKNSFKHYIPYSQEEITAIWGKAIFVFDTNVLLNLYRYDNTTYSQFIEILQELKGKELLKMPYHIGVEFHDNQHQIIDNNKLFYDNIIKQLNTYKNKIAEDIRKYKYHPLESLDDVVKRIQSTIENEINHIKYLQKLYEQEINTETKTENLYSIFEGIVTLEYSEEDFKKYENEAQKRYQNKIPPGYKDIDKDKNKYGDYIIWIQLMEIASENQKNIIFITDDAKTDWWLEINNKTIMPRIELRKEFFSKTKLNFHMYKPDQFLKYYQQLNNYQLAPNTLNTVEQISNESQESNHNISPNIDSFLQSCLHDIDLIFKFNSFSDELYEYDNSPLRELRALWLSFLLSDIIDGKPMSDKEIQQSILKYYHIIKDIISTYSPFISREENTKLHQIKLKLDQYLIENNS